MVSATTLKHVHFVLTILWALMIPIALYTGWIESIVFVSAISLYANFAGHFSSWQATRTEEKQDEMLD
jgi:hypothetical protein